ncbi:MAG: hypothetical protein QOI12_4627 [Alphaproteobacteria bacterium]|nr:hypothetical protein [Alphaproteobacteria bacterium]
MVMRKLVVACAGFAVVAVLGAPRDATAQELYLSQIFIMPGNFCPIGSLPADGRELVINQNTALFSLIGTSYGGNGIDKFRIPLAAPATTNTRPMLTCIATEGIFPSSN